ncbi:hypothetical protein EZS27_003014 [termite gut metagenome]|uniref:Uncharacterized protein n=1 Tax=termite gut metagenome TaxID=433724 RepID=A0A5J4STS9_9ZZZZ
MECEYNLRTSAKVIKVIKTCKKRYHDSHRSTATTQTQNKTRQNYLLLTCLYGNTREYQ